MIAFDETGSGRPVVFLHSGLADRRMWDPQISTFSERYRCVALDLPGYGDSDTPAEPFSYAELIGQFIAEKIGEPAALIGSSFGASRVLETALVAPQWTGPLVMAASAVMRPGEASPDLAALWADADSAWERGERELANEIEIEGWVDGKGRRPGTAAPEARDYFRRVNRSIWERHDAHPVPDSLPGPELELERITQPVLLIDGPYDVPDVLASNQTLLARLPDATYVSIGDTAHFPSYERPEEFNRIVLEFLDRAWGARA